jgi:D-methionine transport system ATP-binding protein
MITFNDVGVTFKNKGRIVNAVKNASFEIENGEIFGIVGTSGAGKSTLLRTINMLQRPTKGKVFIGGKDITPIKGSELRILRTKIGMVFQHFNLISNKTVSENIAFAMKAAGRSKFEINNRVSEVLELVGLTDRANAYPSTLSGGQKQRVGIARAIANNPDILLCDEATSALDLETTNSILLLLKEINRKLGITTVLISHEMHVIKTICDRVAVMTDGNVVELDEVFNIFSHPKHPYTQSLVNHTINLELPPRLLLPDGNRILKIIYSGDKAEEAVLSETIRSFKVDINILHGKIEYITNKPFGILIVQIKGEKDDVKKAELHIKQRTFKVEVIND